MNIWSTIDWLYVDTIATPSSHTICLADYLSFRTPTHLPGASYAAFAPCDSWEVQISISQSRLKGVFRFFILRSVPLRPGGHSVLPQWRVLSHDRRKLIHINKWEDNNAIQWVNIAGAAPCGWHSNGSLNAGGISWQGRTRSTASELELCLCFKNATVINRRHGKVHGKPCDTHREEDTYLRSEFLSSARTLHVHRLEPRN